MRSTVRALIVGVASFLTGATAQAADAYQVDPVHSTVIFRVKHFGVGYIYGRFNHVSGTFRFDESDPSQNAFDVQVKAESIDTNNAGRDKHLRGPDFFNVKEYPTIAFRSNQVRRIDEHTYEATGELTLHGATRPETVRIEWVGAGKDPRGGHRAGLESKFTIKRSDFGMSSMLQGIGDDIQIIAALEGVHK